MTEERALLEEVVAATKRVAESLRLSIEEVGRFAPLSARLADIMSWPQQKDVLSLFKSYEQLVDLLSNRLIRAILVMLGENTTGWSARDAFRRMESRGSLSDAQHFLTLVLLRNRLAHEYPMSAEKRAQRINETLELAPALLSAAEGLLRDAYNLLAEDKPEPDEPESVDVRDELAASIPDDIWVWGPEADWVVVWKPCRSTEILPLAPEPTPELTRQGFRHLYEQWLAMQIEAWEFGQPKGPYGSPLQTILVEAFNAGPMRNAQEQAAYICWAVCDSWLIAPWSQYHGDISWPQKMRRGTAEEVEALRACLLDQPDFGTLIEFWGRGPSET